MRDAASRIESGGIDGSDLGDADNGRDSIVHGASDRRSEQHWDEGIEYCSGSGSTATYGHDDITAWRYGRHSVLNNAAGEWWNDAVQLERECRNAAGRVESGGIDGSDLGNADDGGDSIVHGASEGRSEQHRDEGIEHRGGSGSTATHGHDGVTAWRYGRHSVLNNVAGEWWNDAVQLERECRNAASRVESGGIDGRDLGDADDGRDRIVHGASDRRSEQYWDEDIEYRGGGGSTATNGHDGVTAWRDGRHSVLNNTTGEWWNDAVQLERECRNAAGRVESGGIDGSDLGDADDGRDRIVHGASDRRSEQHRDEGIEYCSGSAASHPQSRRRHCLAGRLAQRTQQRCRRVVERTHILGR